MGQLQLKLCVSVELKKLTNTKGQYSTKNNFEYKMRTYIEIFFIQIGPTVRLRFTVN